MSENTRKEVRLFPKGYFARAKPEAVGDQDVSAIFHAVGFALTNWEQAECALATLFYVVSNATEVNALNAIRRAFGAIESSAGRRRAIRAAAEIYFSHEWTNPLVRDPFDGLLKAFDDGAARRDEIAHGTAYGLTADGTALGAFLYPAEYNTQRTLALMGAHDDPFGITRATYRYTSLNILDYAAKFSELRDKAWEFIGSIRKINGIPAIVLDDRFGEGTAKALETFVGDQNAQKR